jgi:hypothetical protein
MPYEVLKYDCVDDEIEAVIIYYEGISYELGLKFETEIENALNHLERHPYHYFNLEDQIHRRIHIAGFPYAFIYCIDDKVVLIKMLFPQRNDPAKLWTKLGK